MAGLVLANPSRNNEQTDNGSWGEIEQLLESIFLNYLDLFLPNSLHEYRKPSEKWFHIRKVSMGVFLKHYNESMLAYNEQIIDRLNHLFGKFNDVIHKKINLNIEEILEIIEWIQTTENIIVLDLEDLVHTFGKDAMNRFSSLFVCKLYDKYDYRLITDVNPAGLAPIININDKQAICLSVRQLYVAALKHFENIVKISPKAQSFFRHRGTWVEDKTAEIINRYFRKAKMYRNIYESPDSQNEHDIIVLLNDRVFIIEVKTSPPKPPPIDPVKAFNRIRSAFSRSDTGIQKAYDQGLNLKHLIENNKQVDLYDKNGNILVTIDENDYKQGINIICITLDDFGSLATDLSLLLKNRRRRNILLSLTSMILKLFFGCLVKRKRMKLIS
ncbi:MAG: hypothetical protein WBB67_04250 [bacterium]